MKRSIRLTALLATVLALSLCGCGSAQNTKQVRVSVTLADADHELREDAVVSANKRFSKPIRHSGRWKTGGNYDYVFEVPEKLDTLYVQPPVIYHTAEVDPIRAEVPQSMVYLMANAPRTNGAGKNGIEFRGADGAEWFTVDAVIVGGGGGGVHVRFQTATEDAIPQKMLLQLGDSEPIESDKRITFYSQTSMQNGDFNFLIGPLSIFLLTFPLVEGVRSRKMRRGRAICSLFPRIILPMPRARSSSRRCWSCCWAA